MHAAYLCAMLRSTQLLRPCIDFAAIGHFDESSRDDVGSSRSATKTWHLAWETGSMNCRTAECCCSDRFVVVWATHPLQSKDRGGGVLCLLEAGDVAGRRTTASSFEISLSLRADALQGPNLRPQTP